MKKTNKLKEKALKQGLDSLTLTEVVSLILREPEPTLGTIAYTQAILDGEKPSENLYVNAALNLAQRVAQVRADKAIIKITRSRDILNLMHPVIGNLDHEQFWAIFLNRANNIICKRQISKGGMSGTVVDQRLIAKMAIEVGASSIIMAHNHPSGNNQPSEADTAITKKAKDSFSLLDINILDHVIITPRGDYYSFADEGII